MNEEKTNTPVEKKETAEGKTAQKQETVEERLARRWREYLTYKPLPDREKAAKLAREAWALQVKREKEEEARLEAERKKHRKPEHERRLDDINYHLERLKEILPNSLRDSPERRDSIISLLETMKYVLTITDPAKK